MKRFPTLLAVSLLAAPVARAETVRLAVVVGNDSGSGVRGPLHYAQEDAAKVGKVLTELGGVGPNDLYLLRGMNADAVGDAFDRVRDRIRDVHRTNGARALLIFYFSGHSDGEALELGKDRLTFPELRRRLSTTGADVRIGIVDSCRSGALLAAKSGHLQPAFEIRLSDDLPTSGTVLLTSSAADEDALESKEIRGSFFTHAFVSGLRGAADASGDGRITLAEAYRYAYARTVAATARTTVGAQHPAYDMQLSGMGELVLTELTRPTAGLMLPEGFERALVTEPFRDEVLAEVPAGSPRRVAVPAGDYLVRLWRAGHVYAGRELVEAGRTRPVAWTDLQVAALDPGVVAAKGDGPDATDLSTADLARAITFYDALAFEKSAAQLHALVSRDPPGRIAARAHLYLGLIALNLSHPDETRAELELALRANPGIEVPVGSSPKATLALAEAQEALQKELRASRGELNLTPPPASGETVAAPANDVVAAETGPSFWRQWHVPSIALAAVAVAAVSVSIYGGAQVLNYNSMNSSHGGASLGQAQAAYPAAQTWANVWWPLATGGALAGGGAVLAW